MVPGDRQPLRGEREHERRQRHGVRAASATGNQLGRIDIAVAPSNPNVIYAQVQSIAANNDSGCGSATGCQLGVWVTHQRRQRPGASWPARPAVRSGTAASLAHGDYPQNWYDQGIAVDPNNPDRVFVDTFDVWFATRTGTSFNDLTCGYSGGNSGPVHTDQHALAFVPGSSSILLSATTAASSTARNANTASHRRQPAPGSTWIPA